jgi:nuclear pore complex protein Nup205
LRDNSFLLSTIAIESSLTSNALWNGYEFDQSTDFLTNDGAQAMIAYFRVRSSLLDYYSMEIHTSAEAGSLSLVEKYQNALVSLEQRRQFSGFGSRSGKVLSYLDILEFLTTTRHDDPPLKSIELFGAEFVNSIITRIECEDDDEMKSSFVKDLNYILGAKSRELASTSGDTMVRMDDCKKAQRDVSNFIYRRLVLQGIRGSQLKCLQSWTKLVTILVNDVGLRPVERITFVMETFQSVIPKLIDYSSSDIAFAEVLGSLSVSLLQLYQEDIKDSKGVVSNMGHDRTHALYRAALEAILTPHSTPELRSDLYIICYEYLSQYLRFGSPEIIAQNLQCVRAAGDRLIETITSDALSVDGVPRLGAVILLRVLCELSVRLDSSFILDALVRYNLLFTIVASIKRTDVAIGNRDTNSAAQLFFEINAFKGMLCALLELARTKTGANKIIQCGLFEVLQKCQFLNTDPDVGIEFDFGPHVLHGQRQPQSEARVSFYEILVPIFQLVAAVLLSMGSENQAVIEATRQFLGDHQQLIVAVLKKDVVLAGAGHIEKSSQLNDLVKLIVLLVSLCDYSPKKF